MTPAVLLIVATLLPLASFTLLVFVGKRMGKPLAGWVATFAIGGSFICSMLAMVSWLNCSSPSSPGGFGAEWGSEKQAICKTIGWVPVGGGLNQANAGFLDIGIYIDSLTIVMFAMVTGVSLLIHIFSIGYMAEDKRFPRFFTYLSLFCFSMLGLVLGGTLLQLFIFWELVGLCSYLLIGFWYEKKSASNAAIKAFVTNRVGDFGFLIGFGILFYHLGNVTLPHVWGILDISKLDAARGLLVNGQWIGPTLLTVMGIGLFFGAVGKSAQFPLHVWLPDAMEGPTPVSALIHAATMVAAGVYLVGRIFPILTPDAKLFIAIIGTTTLTMAALIAVVQSDIKKVLAYSTLSQLGYMILAMGIGSWVGGLFHLITHAFFKALLFLGSGSVIYAAHHEQEMPQYGGLFRKIPITGTTFGIAVLAIAGVTGLSGYFSKDMILAHAAAFGSLADHLGKSGLYWLFFIIPTCIAFVTAFYMTRCWMLTFWGKPRNEHVYEHAHELPIMWIPLVFLALMSIIGGWTPTGIKGMIANATSESTNYVRNELGVKDFKGFSLAWPVADEGAEAAPHGAAPDHSPLHVGEEKVETWMPIWAPFAAIAVGFLVYFRGYAVADRLMKITPLRWIHTWLYRRMYFDELYFAIFVAVLMAISRFGSLIDRYVIDGIVDGAAKMVRRISGLAGLNDKYVVDGAVDGVADLTQGLGTIVRAPQTGRIRVYVMAFLAVLALGIAGAAAAVIMTR